MAIILLCFSVIYLTLLLILLPMFSPSKNSRFPEFLKWFALFSAFQSVPDAQSSFFPHSGVLPPFVFYPEDSSTTKPLPPWPSHLFPCMLSLSLCCWLQNQYPSLKLPQNPNPYIYLSTKCPPRCPTDVGSPTPPHVISFTSLTALLPYSHLVETTPSSLTKVGGVLHSCYNNSFPTNPHIRH